LFNLKINIMVKVIAAHLRESEKGKFVTLDLLGQIEMVQSQNTGRFYATARRCSIGTTFDLETAKGFIGQLLPGSIGRVPCEPYQYAVPESGEVITLAHTYAYIPQEEKVMEQEEHHPNELELLKV
jgi:hypothetical protein